MRKKIFISLVVVIVILILGASVYYFLTKNKIVQTPIPAPATVPDPTAGWQTKTDSQSGFNFKYPADFFAANQEPKILIGNCNYNVFPESCPNINDIVIADQAAEGGDINAIKSNLSYPSYWKNPNGEKLTVNNVSYCLYQTSDAGMGHVYNYYYYATVADKQCLVVNLNTDTLNCENYLPIETGNTEQQNNYNSCLNTNASQPNILSQILATFKF